MLQLTKGTASENIIVTLAEKQTLTSPYFLFVFTSVTNKTTVTKIFSTADDVSIYPDRYNKFALATVTVFLNKPEGFWTYRVYEQPGAVNTDPASATTLLETGILRLKPQAAFAHEQYNEQQTFKAYNG